jgi:hypothetical protein
MPLDFCFFGRLKPELSAEAVDQIRSDLLHRSSKRLLWSAVILARVWGPSWPGHSFVARFLNTIYRPPASDLARLGFGADQA